MLRFAYLMPDCWLEVSLHPEGPTTGQPDQGSPWFSSILEQMLSWYPEFHVALLVSHAALPLVMSKFRRNVALPMLVQFWEESIAYFPFMTRTAQKTKKIMGVYTDIRSQWPRCLRH
jgi:hypothetical protein